MRRCHWLVVLIVAAVVGSVTAAGAETRYISDQLVVSLRPAPQNSAQAITYLKTDTPVEVLEAGDPYTKVRTGQGEIGYVQSSYLTADTPKPTIIRRLTAETAKLKEQVAALEKRYKDAFSQEEGARQQLVADLENAQQRVATLQSELAATNQELAEVTKAYDTLRSNAENVTAITAERDRLKQLSAELTDQVNQLDQANDRLAGGHRRLWFLAGAGVLVLGWILGKFSRAKRRGGL